MPWFLVSLLFSQAVFFVFFGLDFLLGCVFLQRGALNNKFWNYIDEHLPPVFDKVHQTIF